MDTVLLAEGMAPAVAAYYTAMAKEAGATVKRVHPNKLRLMTGTESHQGVAAFASEIEYATVEDLLAEDFVGNDGLDRRGARQLAAGVFLRHRDVSATLGPVQVELRGREDAIARFTVLAAGGSGGVLPERGQVYEVETGWRLQDGEWRLLNASWEPQLK